SRSPSSSSTKSTWMAIFSNMTARAPAVSNRCVFCPGARWPSSVWSRPSAVSSNRRTSSSVASTRRATPPRWSSSHLARNADFPAALAATPWTRRARSPSSASWSRPRARCGARRDASYPRLRSRKLCSLIALGAEPRSLGGTVQEQVATREETKASEPRYKMKIEKDVDIPMRDGAKLKADVFRPDGDGHFPVLINMGIYQKDKLWIPPCDLEEKPNPHMNWETVNPEWWVPRGYCCVRVDERGS